MPDGPEWVAVAPELAVIYTAALAERVATDREMAVVTDQPDIHGIISGLDAKTMAQVLLDRDYRIVGARDTDTDQVGAIYAAVAIQTVIPDGISDIPRRLLRVADERVMSSPSSVTVPLWVGRVPKIVRSNVVLPAPL